MRLVFDTNIFISAFAIPGGNAEDACLHAIHGQYELFTSIFILTETASILRNKFAWSDDKLKQLLRSISRTATVLKTRPSVHVLKDEPDNRILECAVLAEADMIVAGDRHMLALDRYQNISIVRLSDFVAIFESRPR